MYDVIIIGGGPAGMTAGIYTVRAGLKTLIVEKESIGGQVSETPIIENFPGTGTISGFDLANKLYDQASNLGVEFEFDKVVKINKNKDISVILESNKEYQCKAVIIATGSKNNRLNLDNEERLIGNGIHFCVACDAPFYKNKTVAVIGGANSAVINALYLSDLAKEVYVIYRKDKLRGEKTVVDRLSSKDNVHIMYNSVVKKINGSDSVSSITIENNGNEKEIIIDGVFESIGMHAQNEIVSDLVALDDSGYVISNDCSTELPWLFVAGDCRNKKVRQITTAVSDGTIAAEYVIDYLKI